MVAKCAVLTAECAVPAECAVLEEYAEYAVLEEYAEYAVLEEYAEYAVLEEYAEYAVLEEYAEYMIFWQSMQSMLCWHIICCADRVLYVVQECAPCCRRVYTAKNQYRNWKQIFPEKELRGLCPNFHIHVSCEQFIYSQDRSA